MADGRLRGGSERLGAPGGVGGATWGWNRVCGWTCGAAAREDLFCSTGARGIAACGAAGGAMLA